MEYKQFITKFFENKEKFLKEQLDNFSVCCDATMDELLLESNKEKNKIDNQVADQRVQLHLLNEIITAKKDVEQEIQTKIDKAKEIQEMLLERKDKEITEIKDLQFDKKDYATKLKALKNLETTLEGRETAINIKESMLNQKEKILKKITNGKLN